MSTDMRQQIETALRAFSGPDLRAASIGLLNSLGYRSEKTLDLDNTPNAFLAEFDKRDREFRRDKALFERWKSIEFLFQITDDEVRNGGVQSMFDFDSGYDPGNYQSYLFFALDLEKNHYTRTQLANITREINLLFGMPAMLLMRHNGAMTFSVIDRRIHKKDQGRDVLEKVKLIKDIRYQEPHRAHVEILRDLALPTLMAKHECSDFKQLHEAWRTTLDTDELNKKFYRELADWYFWALDHVWFPDDVVKDEATRNATSVIRLLTRLIFCWFLKEKGLIPNELFSKRKLAGVLKSLNDDESTFYQAILQNLFFGTLNQRMNTSGWENRKFASDGPHHERMNEYGVKNLYRYQKLFALSEEEAVELFSGIPFLNGGLFDCLDKEDDSGKVIYVDGFTRNPRKQPSVPNILFFSDYQIIDLSKATGDKKRKKEKVRGLINLLESYKFTITENTPIEEEIALDPELLGKVFENLLASYNPETGTTARKQTGSFYTPREIVNYMVEESLIAYLETQLKERVPKLAEMDDLQDLLREVFAYTENVHPFDEEEVETLIAAIDTCKILDPACGSGAFPMGILHKLVFMLGKIDPHNERWKQRQLDKLDSVSMRDELERTFRDNDDDYGRKLHLIENCIYGVDIQPIAIQISKLRFFISLICDQRTNNNKADNRGIRPLPNLETKFVAANTLIGLNIPRDNEQISLKNLEIAALEDDLKALRHRYFNARKRREKLACQDKDKDLRKRISELLEKDGWDPDSAVQVADFDPYDQNASSLFFDPEWMFGVRGGFSVTIGNPPYVRADEQSEWNRTQRRAILGSRQYETLWEKWDLYVPFIERAYKLLTPGGVTSLIVSDAYCHSKYAQKSQDWFLHGSRILRLDFFSRIKIFDAGVHNMTYFFQRAGGKENRPERRVHDPEFGIVKELETDEQQNLTYRVFFPEEANTQPFSCTTAQLGQICYATIGMVVNAHERLAPGAFTMEDLVQDHFDSTHPKRFVEGKHLDMWLPAIYLWLEWGTERAPSLFRRPTFPEIYESEHKILVQRSPGPDPKCCIDDHQNLRFTESTVAFIPWHLLKNVRNCSIKKSARYRGEKPPRPDLPRRADLEEASRRFSIKYVLAVMNSTVARDFLRANRRSNIHLYPDDWKKLPIPDVPKEKQEPIVALVDKILDLKKKDPSADISGLEQKIDTMVAELYGIGPAGPEPSNENWAMKENNNNAYDQEHDVLHKP
ncbi:MAG: Eco57I restriction-modification methylase domain-containing protein [Deltaproteobacteria bacterium]|nr:Eco57I restriction-modification methylase domain-containing protein [Deltaproteobacteria bacterium]